MYDQEKKKSRGFGFLSFADESACSKAVAEHFVNIQSKQVKAIFFKSRYKKEIKKVNHLRTSSLNYVKRRGCHLISFSF